MRKRWGRTLEVDQPSLPEREWIFASLARPEIHLPLSCPRPPSRRMFGQGKIYLVEAEGSRIHDVHYLVVRARDDGPRAFVVHYGWDSRQDRVRELDIAVPETGAAGGIGWLFEAHVLIAAFMFGNDLADRLRWRVVSGGRPLSWYRRLGAHSPGTIDEAHPLSGEVAVKQVWDLGRETFEALLGGVGLWPAEGFEVDLWQRLRR